MEEFAKLEAQKLAKIDLDDCCGICLEEYKVREIRTFPCLNHVVHVDCFKIWESSQQKKNETNDLCIFRCQKKDIATTQKKEAITKG